MLLCIGLHCSIAQNKASVFYEKGGGFLPDEVVTYKETPEKLLQLHIFYPKDWVAGEMRPTVVFYFGGGWTGGSVKQFFHQSKYLSSRGVIAICADYRTKKNGAEPYQCVEDAKSAIRYIRSNANSLGVNPNKIAAGGGSAGGHLAAATGTIKNFDSKQDDLSISAVPNALLLFNPVYDNGPNGYGYERVKDYYKSISPIHNIDEGIPPTLVLMGSNDKHTPVETTEQYDRKMKEKGNRCETIIYKGQKHGFFNLWKGDKKSFVETTREMDVFLGSLGFLKGEPIIDKWFEQHENNN